MAYHMIVIIATIISLARVAYTQSDTADTVEQQPQQVPVLEEFYLKGTLDTIRGIVIGTDVAPSGTIPLETVTLRTTVDTVTVYLAPSWYLEQNNISVARFDRIVVAGSRLSLNGRSTLIARELQKQGKKVDLRDKRGNPLWKKESDW